MGPAATTSSSSSSRLLAFVTVALLGTLCGCPGEIDHPERFHRAPARPMCTLAINVETDIFARSCATAGCHAPGAAAQAGLDLGTPGAAARLIGVNASTSSSCRMHGPLVNPDDPTAGLLFDKLGATAPCGSPMPPGGPVLSEAEITCLKAYLFDHSRFADGGAGDDGGGTDDASMMPPSDSGTDATMPRPDAADSSTPTPDGGRG